MDRRDFSLALANPLDTARGTIERREGILIRIGRGIGEATPLPGWTESLPACRRALDAVDAALDGGGAPVVLNGTDDVPPDPLSGAPDAVTDPLADAPAARHAVELAVLDARSRDTGRSLAALLAAEPATSVPVNATIGDASVAETVEAAREAVDAGFDCLKMKVGVGDLERDVARLRAVRAAVGSVDLRADANGAWDRETAHEAIDALAGIDLSYLEQPLAAADLAGHAALRDRGVEVALDETLAERSPAAVLAADAADVLVLKPMALGGPARTVRVARDACAAGVDPVVTTTVDAAIARTAAAHAAAAIPAVRACGLATGDALEADLVPDPIPVAGGRVTVPDGPGTTVDAVGRLFG
ncbi:mandelate racemase/muconate lactonizing enzyme family protein [Haloplanus sp.]|uniref:mandelate racemase/muconate lactonizing enzyme family protein n=1 Tax=Haloplanus sp. TaxID=1961696 RepID=UPI00262F5444|nr:enolase C-terminal domain-like protein [Haloplanus sp.]